MNAKQWYQRRVAITAGGETSTKMASDGSVVVDLEDGSHTISQDQLLFQDIPHTEAQSGDGSSSRGTSRQEKAQTHTFTDFPRPDDSDEEDKTDLLEGKKKQPSFWTFEYYQSFFDVDTRQVLLRILGSMYPNPRVNYLQTRIRPRPDLYGPFWICTTLVFTVAVAGNLANYFRLHDTSEQYKWHYDFHKVTFATTAIFAYWWLTPTLLYCLLWYRGNPANYTYIELICLYGYSLAVYIPISIFWVIQITWLQWLLVMVGMTLSGSVLVMTISPAIRNDTKLIFIGTLVLIVVLHGLLAIGFMLYFFHIPAAVLTAAKTTTVAVTSADANIVTTVAAKLPKRFRPTTMKPSMMKPPKSG